MRVFLIIFILFGLSADFFAQGRSIRQARNHIEAERYLEAIDLLQPLFRADEVRNDVYLMAGMAYLNVPGGAETALDLLSKAKEIYPVEGRISQEAIESRFYLGQALHLNFRFDEAKEVFNGLLNHLRPAQQDVIDAIQLELRYNANAKEMIQDPVNLTITPLGRSINSPYDEHSPVVSLEESTLFFTSNRPLQGMEDGDGRYFENIYVSYWRDGGWTAAEPLELPGSFYGNRATVSVSADGQSLFFFQNDGAIGNLYETRYRFGSWTEPEPFPSPINSGYNETHASISSDGNTLWFTSDRPGGYGGKDIYVSHRLPDETWGEPINAGPNINTELDEESPFLHPDGRTLYFSSEGHKSMGSHDIFRSEMNEDGEWGEPENLGYPINTPGDDLFYMPTPDGQRVYYSSRQPDGIGGADIYLITFPFDDDRSLSVMASHIYIGEQEPASDAIVRIYDMQTEMIQGVFRPNPLTGKVVAVLPAGREYHLEIEMEGYSNLVEKFKIPVRDVYGTRSRAFYLAPIILDPIFEEVSEEEL